VIVLDAQLPPALADALDHAGYPSAHVKNLGLRNSGDLEIWRYATDHHCVIMTKDSDFEQRVLRSTGGPSVIWLRFGNCANALLIQTVLALMPQTWARLQAGDRIVEIR
jgi:predicted nuclease of predicted toxin-antitoxin system